jgi:AcrR family transcriptional regulator
MRSMVKATKKTKKAKSKKVISKKLESKELTMKKLMDAGLEVFSTYGFDGATTKQISEVAGVNESLIARYFNGKQGLLDTMIIEYYKQKQRNTLHYPHGKSLKEELSNFMLACVQDYGQSPKMLQIMIPRMIVDKHFRTVIKSNLQIPNPRLHEALAQFQKKKVIDPSFDLKCITDILLFFLSGVINDRLSLNLATRPIEETVNHFAAMIELYLTTPKK